MSGSSPAGRTRPHEGLSHTWGEGRDLSPNEMFAACVGISGYVPLPLTGDDYIELLPAVFRTVNDYGITIDNRTYDCKALNPYRRLDSGLPGENRTKWEVHYDPYDVTVVWLRDHRSRRVDHRAVGLPHPGRAAVRPCPVGACPADDHRAVRPRPAEADIARNVADLLNRARGQDLSRAEAKAVAIDANRPVHPQPADAEARPIPPDELEPEAEPEPTRPPGSARRV